MNKTLKESREMKESGIEWIGEIPKEWEVIPNKYVMKKIKDICIRYNNEDILSLTMNGVVIRDLDNPTGKMPATFNGYQRLSKGNLLMCLFDIDVTPRCIGLINNNGLTSPAYSQFTLKNNNIAKYYYYYYLNLDFTKELLHLSKNLRNSLTENLLGAVKVPVPPIHEQQAIANYLDEQVKKIDELIAEQNQAIENWKNYKQSLITETVTKGLNPNVEMKDSGIEWIGEIPKAWEVRKLKSIGDTIIGLTYSPEDVTDNGVLVLRSSNVQNGKIVLSDNVFVNKEIKDKLITQVGDILICSRNGSKSLIGKSALITESIAGNTFGAFMTVFRTKHYKFVYYALNSSIFSYYIGSFLTSTINQLTTENLKNIKIALPSSIEQQQIVDFLDEKCSKIDQTIEQKQVLIQQLEEYKQSLIYECVTGKRCVL